MFVIYCKRLTDRCFLFVVRNKRDKEKALKNEPLSILRLQISEFFSN